MAAAWPAAALAERPFRPFDRRAVVSVALAAARPRPRLGAAAPFAAGAEGAPLAAGASGFGPPAGQSPGGDSGGGDGQYFTAGSSQSSCPLQPVTPWYSRPRGRGLEWPH